MGLFNDVSDYGHEDEKTAKTPKHIRGITCDVKNCCYHDGECYCTANKIAVGPSYATNSTDTICSTFKPKTL